VKRRHEFALLDRRILEDGVHAWEGGSILADADARVRVRRVQGEGVLRLHFESSVGGTDWVRWPGVLVCSPCRRVHRGVSKAANVADFERRVPGAVLPGRHCDGSPINTFLAGLGGVWPVVRVVWSVEPPGTEFDVNVSLVGFVG
jgi:hypothetical protein